MASILLQTYPLRCFKSAVSPLSLFNGIDEAYSIRRPLYLSELMLAPFCVLGAANNHSTLPVSSMAVKDSTLIYSLPDQF